MAPVASPPLIAPLTFTLQLQQGRRQRGVRGGHGRPRFGAKKKKKKKHTHTHTRITRSLCICVCTCTPAFFQGLIFGLRVESRLEDSHVLFSTPDVAAPRHAGYKRNFREVLFGFAQGEDLPAYPNDPTASQPPDGSPRSLRQDRCP